MSYAPYRVQQLTPEPIDAYSRQNWTNNPGTAVAYAQPPQETWSQPVVNGVPAVYANSGDDGAWNNNNPSSSNGVGGVTTMSPYESVSAYQSGTARRRKRDPFSPSIAVRRNNTGIPSAPPTTMYVAEPMYDEPSAPQDEFQYGEESSGRQQPFQAVRYVAAASAPPQYPIYQQEPAQPALYSSSPAGQPVYKLVSVPTAPPPLSQPQPPRPRSTAPQPPAVLYEVQPSDPPPPPSPNPIPQRMAYLEVQPSAPPQPSTPLPSYQQGFGQGFEEGFERAFENSLRPVYPQRGRVVSVGAVPQTQPQPRLQPQAQEFLPPYDNQRTQYAEQHPIQAMRPAINGGGGYGQQYSVSAPQPQSHVPAPEMSNIAAQRPPMPSPSPSHPALETNIQPWQIPPETFPPQPAPGQPAKPGHWVVAEWAWEPSSNPPPQPQLQQQRPPQQQIQASYPPSMSASPPMPMSMPMTQSYGGQQAFNGQAMPLQSSPQAQQQYQQYHSYQQFPQNPGLSQSTPQPQPQPQSMTPSMMPLQQQPMMPPQQQSMMPPQQQSMMSPQQQSMMSLQTQPMMGARPSPSLAAPVPSTNRLSPTPMMSSSMHDSNSSGVNGSKSFDDNDLFDDKLASGAGTSAADPYADEMDTKKGGRVGGDDADDLDSDDDGVAGKSKKDSESKSASKSKSKSKSSKNDDHDDDTSTGGGGGGDDDDGYTSKNDDGYGSQTDDSYNNSKSDGKKKHHHHHHHHHHHKGDGKSHRRKGSHSRSRDYASDDEDGYRKHHKSKAGNGRSHRDHHKNDVYRSIQKTPPIQRSHRTQSFSSPQDDDVDAQAEAEAEAETLKRRFKQTPKRRSYQASVDAYRTNDAPQEDDQDPIIDPPEKKGGFISKLLSKAAASTMHPTNNVYYQLPKPNLERRAGSIPNMANLSLGAGGGSSSKSLKAAAKVAQIEDWSRQVSTEGGGGGGMSGYVDVSQPKPLKSAMKGSTNQTDSYLSLPKRSPTPKVDTESLDNIIDPFAPETVAAQLYGNWSHRRN